MTAKKAAAKKGFKAVTKAAAKGGAKDPAAVAYTAGVAKYGKEGMAKKAAAGRKAAAAKK